MKVIDRIMVVTLLNLPSIVNVKSSTKPFHDSNTTWMIQCEPSQQGSEEIGRLSGGG